MRDDKIEIINKAIEFCIETNNAYFYRVKENIERIRSKKFVIGFGAGKFFRDAYPYVRESFPLDFIVDNNQKIWGETIQNVECFGPQKLNELHKDEALVIIFIGKADTVEKQLDEMGVEHITLDEVMRNMYTSFHDANWFKGNRARIIEGFQLLEDELSKEIFVHKLCNIIAPHLCDKNYVDYQTVEEYFDMPFWHLSENEGFLDVGAYTGDTIEKFIKVVKGKYNFVYGYEMDKIIFSELKQFIAKKEYKNIYIDNRGIGISKEENDNFCQLDETKYPGKVTMLKMDIEGFEQDALRGSKEIINNDTPKLAICVYHRLEDLWEIPILIHEINKSYKLYIRHHSPIVWDTVCYACL